MTPSLRHVSPLILLFLAGTASAQTHEHHDHGHGMKKDIKPPKIFLDKSPRIVAYQLKRLDNERLLLVERSDDDPKYAPVHAAIFQRAGISPQHREEALAALVKINNSDAPTELLTAIETLKPGDRQDQRTANHLAAMLLKLPAEELANKSDAFLAATDSKSDLVRPLGYAALIASGQKAKAWERASDSPEGTLDWLAAVPLVPNATIRAQLRDEIVGLLDDAQPLAVRKAAIGALAHTPAKQAETFGKLAPYVSDPKLRQAAVKTLLSIPGDDRDPKTSEELVKVLVELAESTPPNGRTTDPFIDAMQLADQLLARVPAETSRAFRQRLRETVVRVVRISTVEEEMRYDTPYFAVEAGRPVQVILRNEDLMPHNLVITTPGKLKEVAELGLQVGPKGGYQGKQYVPESADVLHATDMVQPRKQERLTFTAPSEPGEYPYVCTFPRHWMRMYGVMVVVDDLDAWQKNPTEPKDPVGSNRPFVKSWTYDDLKDHVASGLQGRTPEIGARIFKEATCAQCHKIEGEGGSVGPELTEVFKRWKGDRQAVLREILEPSHRIDPNYAMHVIVTADGDVISGIIKAEDKESVSILVNPEAPKPTVVQRDDIDEMVKTSKSMMPKALLDRFTQDEIFELLAYLESVNHKHAAAGK
ncbi:Auracyanin-A precursor [Planctomycetes bacterium Pan216]|uniref:Auracyanin-A n=1 Tax=Kolteria novifilia TaxID=2527975 RepID=A0A518B4L6_9BACT|nr:Auracyanin-A precursor [Planctomycetes bacterium Pan216]